MKIYKVKVNGKVYEVELESVTESTKKVEKDTTAPVTNTSVEGEALVSPMQGTILKVNVAVGDKVTKGQVVMIIEAMKLESEIVAPKDGIVKAVKVNKGQVVNSKETLLILG